MISSSLFSFTLPCSSFRSSSFCRCCFAIDIDEGKHLEALVILLVVLDEVESTNTNETSWLVGHAFRLRFHIESVVLPFSNLLVLLLHVSSCPCTV